MVFRLPEAAVDASLTRILRPEMPIKSDKLQTRWVTARTAQGPVPAIAFPTNRSSPAFLPGLTQDVVVKALATAAGQRRSMADYLILTVQHLKDRGVHDPYLWRRLALVADRIAALFPSQSRCRPQAGAIPFAPQLSSNP